MKKSTKIFAAIAMLFVMAFSSCNTNKDKQYTYESVPIDPLHARIYTLSNGLKVYMTVYKNAPRVQTFIAVCAGSKNDPKDATGLAHYLEHLLFKGTDAYGSKDYAKEKPQLDKIEALYEVYRQTKDVAKRKTIYHQIDSISGVASKFAIANEYDKMVAVIGAEGTNAYTSLEQTVYMNDIPSNQLEKWITIEAERFRNPVLRLFHTELEAVYEEKNGTLDSDEAKAWEALYAGLWPNNTYGSQTTIGTIEHLKNPSLTKIKKYLDTYYVPNNMAICMSGDFDPDATIQLIEKKFGAWKSKPVPAYQPYIEKPISSPVVKEMVGPDAANVTIGYRFAGAGSKDADMITLINQILSNGKAGLIDLNLNQQQKVLRAAASDEKFKDYSAHTLSGTPKEGQTLEEVKDLLLQQIQNVQKGNFPDRLLSAIITDMQLKQTKNFENNQARADAFVNSFTTGTAWEYNVGTIERLSKITKQQVIDFAKANYGNNYVIVYKRTGEDKNVQKVEKPTITPVDVNRDDQSTFVANIITAPTKDIEPVFIDYAKDIQRATLKNGIPIFYNENTENKTFDMYYVVDMGTDNNKKLGVAIQYLKYLGTNELSASEVQQKFYELGCSFGVSCAPDQIGVSLRGLTANSRAAIKLFENLLAHAQPDEKALKNLVADILKDREDAKLDKGKILGALGAYGQYGKQSAFTNILSSDELKNLNAKELISLINSITSYEHRVLYYGNDTKEQLVAMLNDEHKVPEKLKPVPPPVKYKELEANTDVYVVDYDMKQAEILMLSKDGAFNQSNIPTITLFNQYFGGDMSSVVFQEMRESKALAYSVSSMYQNPEKKSDSNYVFSSIGTQADKLPEAMAGMKELVNNMPESANNFEAAKEAIIQGIRTARITRSGILFDYEQAKKLGLDHDIRKDVFAKVPAITFATIKAFEEQHLKNKQYTILVVGKKSGLDMKTLEKYGKVIFLSLKDIFGY